MREALEALASFRARAAAVGVTGNRDYNPGWHTALDLQNLLDVSEAITRSALERRESRGGHYRDDFPAKDAGWGTRNVLVRRTPEGGMVVEHVAIPEMPAELRQVIDEQE
jgi:succinate dehydrogenase / fumarate reductase flavoprotein subunit